MYTPDHYSVQPLAQTHYTSGPKQIVSLRLNCFYISVGGGNWHERFMILCVIKIDYWMPGWNWNIWISPGIRICPFPADNGSVFGESVRCAVPSVICPSSLQSINFLFSRWKEIDVCIIYCGRCVMILIDHAFKLAIYFFFKVVCVWNLKSEYCFGIKI